MGNRQSQGPVAFHELNRSESRRPKNKMVMDRLRKSFRDSFRKKRDHIPESSKPHQWQADEQAVRSGNCVFPVKYLGCVEVFESRGMQICEEALRLLRNSKRRPIKGNLFVTGDGLRVVDENTKGLIVDQTIEKVSFCAPDRNHEKGFSYICRDGTTRRWMCHGFHAIKDSGERLSHAVGCAFTVCLERKQKRDKEAVTASFDTKTSTFTRTGSFRQTSITERLTDPQECKPSEPPPVKPVHNPYAIQRPHATPQLLQRQGSFRALSELNQTSSPFKRQLSLRVNDLPSNLERQRAHSLESSNLYDRPNGTVPPIPEVSPVAEKDSIKALCEEVSQGLSLLSKTDDPFVSASRLTSEFTPNQEKSNRANSSSPNPTVLPREILKLYSNSPVPAPNPNLTSVVEKSVTQTITVPLPPTATTFSTLTPLAPPVAPPPRRSSPNFSQLRSQSLGSSDAFMYSLPNKQQNFNKMWGTDQEKYAKDELVSTTQKKREFDPFDAEWVALGPGNENGVSNSTNPFAQVSTTVKAFEVQM